VEISLQFCGYTSWGLNSDAQCAVVTESCSRNKEFKDS
jgi:hypothetical protein